MASYNRVILIGNLTRDPELRYTPTSLAVADIGLAINDRRKGQNGDWVEETTFVDITLWGRIAEVVSEYCSKGSPLMVEGRLKFDSWEGNDGQKKSKLKVIGEKIQLLGGGTGGQRGGGNAENRSYSGTSGGGGGAKQQQAPQDAGYYSQQPSYDQDMGGSLPEDEIPF
ncbi:MAG: single-stranded DNA-binding protein [Planctomycetaceae bacterium]|jgi:single-strand DNA-binding protein|nr:single-stranded DNA-binding protein [Planctomycetaceae bacterium]